ncbi:uncharacterized protein A1O9_03313 [Exophiala aquamarina CBS 119918]|uniref:Rap-GAP domain-containing protein n=1 Tax=Exophiala aquamarina CBS 119918 TaxID=1182545 RepID=A0A072PQZ0_9EURO|nr:uncharacterized protein A1O9_03313 [Exophiala aquamarina CBS 119918]KEF61743.1 hypothetical protein A1O9_03313 [Exophiala aquamarina CBS 119918]
MSTENDSLQGASTDARHDVEPKDPSLPPHSTSQQDLDGALTASRSETASEKSSDNGPVLNLSEILRQGLALSESSDEVRQWLLAFDDHKPGTDVSYKLQNATQQIDGDSANGSLLSLLNQWLALWSVKSDRERKENKTARTTSHKEQKHLDWLLRYVADFITLGHSGIDVAELSQTVETITTICLNASRQSDINAGINVLHAIAANFDFPESGLEQTLVVLCASTANLPETPEHLFDCAKILATGYLSEQVINVLFSFILTPTAANNSKNLSHARGATRLLRILLPEMKDSGQFILPLEDTVDTLYTASIQGIFRFGHDVLSTFHSLLSCNTRQEEITNLDFGKIVGGVSLCLKASPLSSQTGRSENHALPPTPLQEDDHRQYERHFRDRETMAKKIGRDLGTLFEHLGSPAREIIDEFFLSYPQFAEAHQLMLTLGNLKDHYLQADENEIRREYADKVYQHIVRNTTLPLPCRLRGIEIVLHSGDRLTEGDSDSTRVSTHAYSWILDKLLTQIDIERDRQVFEMLLRSLQYMAGSYEAAAQEPALTMRTLEKLSSLIFIGPTSGSWNGGLAILAARVLVTIFAYSLHTDANAAVRAFEILLEVASPRCKSRIARLVSKRLLFRLRADDAGYIYINTTSESSDIAAALLRTRESAEIFTYEIPTPQRHSASSTSLSTRSDANDPIWIYPDTEEVDHPFAGRSSEILNVDIKTGAQIQAELDMDTWLMNITRCLQTDVDWETYSYTIVHVGAQLSNIALFLNSIQAVIKLRQVLCGQIVNATFREAPVSSGLKKSDVAICMFHFLTSLIPYATMKLESIQKGFGDDLVRAFISGLGASWEGTSRNCIHALSVCSLEIPSSVATLYPTIIDKMSKNMTQAHLTSHILEFLTEVALQTEMHSNLNPDEIQIIFGICIQFLEKTREQYHTSSTSQGRASVVARHSGMNFRRPPYRAAMLTDHGMPQYAAALAYHNMIFWFLSLRLETRAKYISWIVPRLVWKNSRGEETIDEQSQVLIDMMQRTAFSDLGETSPDPNFAGPDDGPVSTASWIVGLSVITAETAGRSGKSQITKRQASGTTYATYQQNTARLPSHHTPSQTEIRHQEATTEILPSHVLLQMMASAATTSLADQPIQLPQEDYVTRALEIFDRVPTVASHKIGVLYIGPGQLTEPDYLANTSGSQDFERLLGGLGYVVSLQPPLRYNPQGLEYPRDGENTIAWRDRVAEIVYHVPTLMPTDLEEDPQCITKKSHVGNCHVNIVFNRSGAPWEMDNFRSQLNYVNIVIRPACRGRVKEEKDFIPGFYRVHVITKDGLPNLSPAAEPKIISAAKLAQFVRVLAINASQFCGTWNTKDSDTEYPSEWRTRLQHIKMLKERVMAKSGDKQLVTGLSSNTTTSSAPGSSGGRRTPVPRDELSGPRRDGTLAAQLDFSSWTL